jgi:hypothetical protein
MLLLAGLLLVSVRCEDEEKAAWKRAYDAYYAGAYQEGIEAGDLRGRVQGAAAGVAEAERNAQSGEAWQLYTRLVVSVFLSGLLIGIALQYTILLRCRRFGRLDQLQTVLLVPAMRLSLAYSIFMACVSVELEMDEALRKVRADSNVKKAELLAAHDAIRRRIRAASSIETLTSARFVELAEEEFSRIISTAEETGAVHDPRRSSTVTQTFRGDRRHS